MLFFTPKYVKQGRIYIKEAQKRVVAFFTRFSGKTARKKATG